MVVSPISLSLSVRVADHEQELETFRLTVERAADHLFDSELGCDAVALVFFTLKGPV